MPGSSRAGCGALPSRGNCCAVDPAGRGTWPLARRGIQDVGTDGDNADVFGGIPGLQRSSRRRARRHAWLLITLSGIGPNSIGEPPRAPWGGIQATRQSDNQGFQIVRLPICHVTLAGCEENSPSPPLSPPPRGEGRPGGVLTQRRQGRKEERNSRGLSWRALRSWREADPRSHEKTPVCPAPERGTSRQRAQRRIQEAKKIPPHLPSPHHRGEREAVRGAEIFMVRCAREWP